MSKETDSGKAVVTISGDAGLDAYSKLSQDSLAAPSGQVPKGQAKGVQIPFDSRADIRVAMNALDIWASCKHHTLSGAHGTPTLGWLDGTQGTVSIRLAKVGRHWVPFLGTAEQWSKVPGDRRRSWETSSTQIAETETLNVIRLIELSVDQELGTIEATDVLIGLLLHRYPRNGAYAKPLRSYRPDAVYKQFQLGRLGGRHMQRRIDDLLAQMERDFLALLAEDWRGRLVPQLGAECA